MANFLRTRALWADDTDFLWTEAEDLDIKSTAAINGEGGTYSLIDNLVIGSAGSAFVSFDVGVSFTDNVEMQSFEAHGGIWLDGGMLITGTDLSIASTTVDVSGVLTVAGPTFLQGGLDISGPLDVTGPAVLHQGLDVTGELTATGPTFLQDGLDVTGALDVTGEAAFNGGAVFYLGSTYLSPLTIGTGGYIKRRTLTVTGSLPVDIGPSKYDEVLFSSGFSVTGTPLTYEIKDTGIENGAAMTFVTASATNAIYIFTPGSTALLGLLLNSAGSTSGNTHMRRIDVRRQGGVWFTYDSEAA